VELQRRYADIRKQGLGLIAVSYDAPETLKRFADSRGITFPLISDTESAIIKAFGLLNQSEKPGSRTYGIPHPGTFIVDRKGIVLSRFFEDAYQERYTTATILSSIGGAVQGLSMKASTPHLAMTATVGDTVAAPGERLSIAARITPGRGMHLYAPGKHTYQVVELIIDPQPWLRLHEVSYPPSEIYHFKPLDERIEVYMKPFTLRRDLTLLATQQAQKELASLGKVAITGALAYQACDDKVCFNPTRVPISFTVQITPLDRRPPGGG
jgi:hypothetical protein